MVAFSSSPKLPGLSRGSLGIFGTAGILSTGTLEQRCSLGNLPLPPGDSHRPSSNQGNREKFSPRNHQEERENGTPAWKREEKTPPGHQETPVCPPPSLWSVRPLPLLHPWMCPAASQPRSGATGHIPSLSFRLSLPKSDQGGSSKPFSMIPHPLAGPGVELRGGYGHTGKGHDSRDLQPNTEISPRSGKRGEKTLGNPFFLPKSKPQDTLRVTPFPLPRRRTQTHGSSQIFVFSKGIN